MKNRYLFPHRFKKIGWLLFVPAVTIGLVGMIFNVSLFSFEAITFAIYDDGILGPNQVLGMVENDLYDEILGTIAIVGGLLAAFSKEKNEDEYIAQIRLESLLWATYINYGFLLFSILFIYGGGFYAVMILNILTLLLIFLVRFNYILYKTAHSYA